MTRLRIKLGTYETDLTEDEFRAALQAWLSHRGKISEVQGRGLVVSRHSQMGRPGNIGQVILGIVRDKPGITEAQIGRKLTDYSPMQVKNGIRRLIRVQQLSGSRVQSGSKHFVYEITPEGEARLDEFLEAERMAKNLALRVWAACKTLGYRDGSIVDYGELLGEAELTTVEMTAGIKVLVKARKMVPIYVSGEKTRYKIVK